MIRVIKNPKKFKSMSRDANILDLEKIMKEKLGINVFIKNKKNNRGSLTFEYKDLDQLNRLIMVIKSSY